MSVYSKAILWQHQIKQLGSCKRSSIQRALITFFPLCPNRDPLFGTLQLRSLGVLALEITERNLSTANLLKHDFRSRQNQQLDSHFSPWYVWNLFASMSPATNIPHATSEQLLTELSLRRRSSTTNRSPTTVSRNQKCPRIYEGKMD